jgi:hypothetical protein
MAIKAGAAAILIASPGALKQAVAADRNHQVERA